MWRGAVADVAALYADHAGAVLRYALRLTGNREDAEDVAQTVWEKVVRGALGDIRPRGAAALLRRVTRTTAIDTVFRPRALRPPGLRLDGLGASVVPGDTPAARTPAVLVDQAPLPDERACARVGAGVALRAVSPVHRPALCLWGALGLNDREVARRLGVPRSTARTRILLGRLAAQRALTAVGWWA